MVVVVVDPGTVVAVVVVVDPGTVVVVMVDPGDVVVVVVAPRLSPLVASLLWWWLSSW